MDETDQLIGNRGPAEVGQIVSITSTGDVTRDEEWAVYGRVVSIRHFADESGKRTRVALGVGPGYEQSVRIIVASNHRVKRRAGG